LAAVFWANSPWSSTYFELQKTDISLQFGPYFLSQPLLLWINDGLMAIFFFVVGLEIKREVLVGALSKPGQAVVPIGAAVGGMLLPAGLFWIFNAEAESVHGWGIPMATDIAFALGVLTLLGDRVPVWIKLFLTATAIADDIGAIFVIALLYSNGFSASWFMAGFAVWLVMYVANRLGIRLRSFMDLLVLSCG
jgi:Na+:H+ antiporter, NhaA family